MHHPPQRRQRPAWRLAVALCVLILGSASPASSGAADSGVSAKEADVLKVAFPDADRFDSRDVLLSEEIIKRIEKVARARVKERMVTFYTARKGGNVSGYAVIHSHVVRTKSETFTLAFEPDGKIRRISIVAFQEPAEYQPTDKWLDQFKGKRAGDRLTVGDDVAPITGATLSARSIAEESRVLLQTLQATMLEAKP